MERQSLKRRLSAVMVADVVGYSKLVGSDEAGTVDAIQHRWDEALKPLVAANNGVVVKFIGDGALVEFPSAVDAVRAALGIQKKMAEINDEHADAPPIRLRIGINLGDVLVQNEDIFGDDVNIAARLEALSEPDEVCVSQSVYEAVRGKLPFIANDLGDVVLKNINKRVRAFAVRGSAGENVRLKAEKGTENVLSIAVLPFDNMSGVPEHDYIGEGISENIMTDLARFRDLTVIARNSSFAYKGKATRVQDIRRDLGANYVLEGSVQKLGERIRVNAQLIDGASGRHVWAERYDRRADDLFTLMDEITELIVATLATTYGGRLRKAAADKAASAGPTSFQAFDCFVEGMAELNRGTSESTDRALALFQKALDENPRYAKAYAKSCWAHIFRVVFGWSDDEEASWDAARVHARAALAADDSEAWAHWAMAGCDIYTGNQDRAMAGMRRAIDLNPNDADVLADMGLFLSYVGKAEDGLAYASRANRINPNHPAYYDAQLGQIYFSARRYEDAINTFEGLHDLSSPDVLVYLAASHAAINSHEKAAFYAGQLMIAAPRSTVSQWTSEAFVPYTNPQDREHLANNLRLAGVAD